MRAVGPATGRQRPPLLREKPALPADCLGGRVTVVYAYNPLDNMDRALYRAKAGKTLEELAPATKAPILGLVNGVAYKREDWKHVELCDDDQCTFQFVMQGGGNSGSVMAVLGIVLIVAGVMTGGNPYLIGAGASLLVSGLAPTPDVGVAANVGKIEAPSPTYNIALGGNTARLGQPIPVPYGKNIVVPDFASKPYVTYDENDNQYYHAILCFGAMTAFTTHSVTIGDTVIEHFNDVQRQYWGAGYPGNPEITLVDPLVVSAEEVAEQELLLAQYAGPVAACGPGKTIRRIGFDIACPKGLYFAADDGTLEEKTVEFLFEYRRINNTGAAIGSWAPLGGIQSLTLAQNSVVRRSYEFDTSVEGRFEVRGTRIDAKDTNARAGHDIIWIGLRAFLVSDEPQLLDPNANYMAVKILATGQLSPASQRQISMVNERHLPTWDPIGGWSDPVPTSSIAWAVADMLKNTVYGGRQVDSRIDLETLYELDQIWASRGDEFNYVFDRRMTLWQALTLALRAGRAKPCRRGGAYTFVRDDLQTLPRAIFTMRNIKRGSFNMDVNFTTDDNEDLDGVEVTFFNRDTWAEDYVRVPFEGVEECVNPWKINLPGVTNRYQAQREAAYMGADIVKRPGRASLTTEMQGYLPAFGDLVWVIHDITGMGTSGEIVNWDPLTFTAELSDEPQWSVGTNYMMLVNRYGDPVGPFAVTPGATSRHVVFAEDPESAELEIYTGIERDRTLYAMGAGASWCLTCKIEYIDPQGDEVNLGLVIEDTSVHFADELYSTPTPGPDRLAVYMEEDQVPYAEATEEQRNAGGFYADEDELIDGDAPYVHQAGAI